MNFLSKRFHKILAALGLVILLTFTAACSNTLQAEQPTNRPAITSSYQRLERGDTAAGQNYGDWVVQAGAGLIQDAYVRDNNKLGVVISSQVKPQEVRPLARSLMQGFQRNFPKDDLKVLVYAPDKQLILTADYDAQRQQIEYQ